ncbi:MAG: polysaccharide deacetylase family protein [Deltaproteobacteria bacterium]|nr:polysaccharide deacetylase family protein [Deltaproteobacteria bacterium]MBP6831043.1 polysaccharide deacetylase family protein [Deltaproteobacteria bacterium]
MSVPRLAATLLLSLLSAAAPSQATPVARARRSLLGGQHIDGRCPPRFRRCLAFTFDDGPEIRTTPRLLDMLDAHHVRATFFVVGHRIDGEQPHHRAQRGLLREIVRRGHLLGNHTYHHVVLGNLRPSQIAYEIDRTGDIVERTTGRRPELMRAPFGLLTAPRSLGAVAARNLTPAYWMIDTHDWEVTSAEAVQDRFRRELLEHPYGGVVLMHDTRPWSVRAFPLIMQVVARRNAELVARGEAPFAILNLDQFVTPRGNEALRGAPLNLRRPNARRGAATRASR